jgi:hypothetical protein
MESRRIIAEGASFDAGKLKVLFEAFDRVWAEVAGGIGSDPRAIGTARTRLACIILTLAEHGNVDLADLESSAKRLFRDPVQTWGATAVPWQALNSQTAPTANN